MSTYTVVAGDTLWGIAARHLGAGDRWPEIAAASRVHHPDLIHPGQVLTIPTDGAHAAAADTLAAETIGPEGAGLVLRLPGGWFVSSRWGWREFAGYQCHLHTGHDLAGMANGTPIRLGGAARVHLSGHNTGGYGHYVVIKTADGARWLLGHLAQPGPHAGATIEAGQALALVGSTGASTGPHIHLERWPAGGADWKSAVDPAGLYRVETA